MYLPLDFFESFVKSPVHVATGASRRVPTDLAHHSTPAVDNDAAAVLLGSRIKAAAIP